MRSWRWVGPVIALALVVGLVAGCGGSGGGGGSDGGGSSGGGNSSDGGGSSGGGNSSGGGGSSDEGLAWVPFGPDDPKLPDPNWDAYRLFAQHDCPGLRDSGSVQVFGNLGKAMVAVCFAAVEGQQDQWEVAAEALAAGGASSNECLNKVVRKLLNRALAWHRRHPGQKPAVGFPEVAGKIGERKTQCGKQAPPTEPTTTEPTTTPTEPTTTEPTTTEPTTTEPTTETTG